MPRVKLKLDIETCLIMGNVNRMEKGLEPVKTKRQLAKLLLEDETINVGGATLKKIYFKLYRYEKDGFYNEDKALIKAVCKVLKVKRLDLVKRF